MSEAFGLRWIRGKGNDDPSSGARAPIALSSRGVLWARRVLSPRRMRVPGLLAACLLMACGSADTSDESAAESPIVGGVQDDDTFRAAGYLMFDGKLSCGATVIDAPELERDSGFQGVALTAAHCVPQAGHLGAYSVGVGALRERQRSPVGLVVVHPGFKVRTETVDHDLAVLFLTARLNERVSMGIPTLGAATQIGYGHTSTRANPNMIAAGERRRGGQQIVSIGSVLATEADAQSGNCFGDSGGALMQGDSIVGISSFNFTNGCAVGGRSGFTNVDEHRSFVVGVVRCAKRGRFASDVLTCASLR